MGKKGQHVQVMGRRRLGSWWTLALLVPVAAVLAWRLLDDERILARDLPGYPEYMRRVKHHLIPYVW